MYIYLCDFKLHAYMYDVILNYYTTHEGHRFEVSSKGFFVVCTVNVMVLLLVTQSMHSI